MTTKTVTVRLLSLSNGKLGYFCRTQTDESRKREYSETRQAGQPSLHLKHNLVTRQGAALSSLQEFDELLPEPNQPGIFVDSTGPSLLSPEGRTAVQEQADDEFHDSDSGLDVFAVYNACNGIIRNGFLDVSELDKYSPEEAEALNVPRLREIWKHTTTGCSRCREIIEALNVVRGAVGQVADNEDQDDRPKHIEDINSISK